METPLKTEKRCFAVFTELPYNTNSIEFLRHNNLIRFLPRVFSFYLGFFNENFK